MAGVIEITSIEGILALPPIQHVAPVVNMPYKEDDQSRPSANEVSAIGASTTLSPPQQILVQASSNIIFRGCS